MGRRVFLAAVLTCLAGVGVVYSGDEGEFKPLFDGKSLDGWVLRGEKADGENPWSVKGGILSAKTGQTWLSTKEKYENFVLKLEWRVPANGNSGVFLRVPDLKTGETPWDQGVEIQCLDDKGDQYAGKIKPWQYSGSIYGAVAAENSTYKGAGEWNSYEITCQRELIKVVMNGKLVSQAAADELEVLKNRPRKGYIGLQNHGTPVEFRNVQIKVLK